METKKKKVYCAPATAELCFAQENVMCVSTLVVDTIASTNEGFGTVDYVW